MSGCGWRSGGIGGAEDGAEWMLDYIREKLPGGQANYNNFNGIVRIN